uniref:Uncharacterized protein n=1 Tax=Schistocephalus solidus TaxID=70667 RepID=A0A0X3P4P5_SCHSO
MRVGARSRGVGTEVRRRIWSRSAIPLADSCLEHSTVERRHTLPPIGRRQYKQVPTWRTVDALAASSRPIFRLTTCRVYPHRRTHHQACPGAEGVILTNCHRSLPLRLVQLT